MFSCKAFRVLFFLCVFPSFVLAEIQVNSSVSPNPVSLQGVLTLTVEIKYSSEKNIGAPRLPGLNTFHVIGQHQSHEFQMINGVTTRKKKYHYQLQPMKEGKFNIGSIEVIVDGKVHKTASLPVEVSSKIKPRSAPSSPFGSLKGLRRFFPPFFDADEKEEDGVFPFFRRRKIDEEDMFLKLETKKSKVYVGEMILAEWFFYLPYNQAMNINSEVVKSPNLDGFWVESVVQMGEVVSKPPQVEDVKGKKYKKQLLISSALFPVRKGDLNIGSLEVKSHLAFPFMASRVFLKKSKAKKVTVLPLPQEGKGNFFTEAVGDFHVSSNINKKVVSVQEPVVYKVSFKGKGQTRVIRLPNLQFGNVWEVYDTTESQKFSVSESVKDFEVILIPQSSGELIIPSFEVSTFDPQLGIYKTHILPAFKIRVVGVPTPGTRKDESALYFQTEEQHKSKEAKAIHQKEEKSTLTPWLRDKKSEFVIKYRKDFWVIVYSLLFLFFTLVLVRNFSFKREKNRLKIILRVGLKKVDQAIKSADWKQSGIEMNQLMYSFFSELLGQNTAVKNWDILLKDMNPSIRIKYESKIRSLVSHLERLSFASSESAGKLRNKKSVAQLKVNLIDLLKQISKEYTLPESKKV